MDLHGDIIIPNNYLKIKHPMAPVSCKRVTLKPNEQFDHPIWKKDWIRD